MKRLPLLFSLLAVIALSASMAYWVIALYKPPQRPLAAMVETGMPDPAPDAAGTLFGGQMTSVVLSNYQLTGVVAAGPEGVAILVADGQPPRALKVGKEIAAGVSVREVHPKYVILSEGGVMKRIELARDAKAGTSLALAPPASGMNQPPNMQEPPPNSVPVLPNAPMEVPQVQDQPQQMPPGVPPPPPSPTPNMPAPTRGMSGQGGQPPTQ